MTNESFRKKITQDLQTLGLGRRIKVLEIREVIKLKTERSKFSK